MFLRWFSIPSLFEGSTRSSLVVALPQFLMGPSPVKSHVKPSVMLFLTLKDDPRASHLYPQSKIISTERMCPEKLQIMQG